MDRNRITYLFELYLKGEATEEDIEKICAYIVQDKGLAHWMERGILESSDEIDPDLKLRMLDSIKSKINKDQLDEKTRYRRRILSNILKYAAIFILPLILGVSLYYNFKTDDVRALTIVTQPGEKAATILPDNSKIDINSDSKIVYYTDFNKENRFVSLEGEAFFNVAHDKTKPFIVKCSDIKVTVLGTSFGIQSYKDDDNISVTLHTGKIRLTTPNDDIFLHPNETAVYNKKKQQITVENANPRDYSDWRLRRLRFDNKSMEQIANLLMHTHNIVIAFEDDKIKKEHFTGTVDNRNIETVLNMISMTSSIGYKVLNDTVILYNKPE